MKSVTPKNLTTPQKKFAWNCSASIVARNALASSLRRLSQFLKRTVIGCNGSKKNSPSNIHFLPPQPIGIWKFTSNLKGRVFQIAKSQHQRELTDLAARRAAVVQAKALAAHATPAPRREGSWSPLRWR